MTDNPLSPTRQPEDIDAALRPKTLDEFIGPPAALRIDIAYQPY